jgi:hypothetical protein
VKPAIDDAAQRAVDDIAPAVSTTVDPSPDPGSESTVVTAPTGDDKGAIVNVALPVSAPQGQTSSNFYTVPAGKVLRITDLVIQNPQFDQGTLVVSRDGNTLFSYSFAVMFGADVDQPLVTPIELAANQQLTVAVTCDGVGDLTATGCNANVFVSGRLIDA